MFFDWDGDGDDDLFDDMMDYAVIHETLKEEERETNNNSNSGGGCCLFSFLLICMPFAGVIALIGSLVS